MRLTVFILVLLSTIGCAAAMAPGALRAELERRIVLVDDRLAGERHPLKAERLRLCDLALQESYALMRAGHLTRAERALEVARDLMGEVR